MPFAQNDEGVAILDYALITDRARGYGRPADLPNALGAHWFLSDACAFGRPGLPPHDGHREGGLCLDVGPSRRRLSQRGSNER